MGNDKQHYDITMSRRTRKPPKVRDENENENPSRDCPPKDAASEGEDNDRKSLKELIDGDGETKAVSAGDEGGEGRSSLGQHFREGEKQLPLVLVQQKEGLQGLKLKKMVSRYAKILGHLMKKNRDPSLRDSQKKPVSKLIFQDF